jgi:hypothetical protein
MAQQTHKLLIEISTDNINKLAKLFNYLLSQDISVDSHKYIVKHEQNVPISNSMHATKHN